MTRHRILAMAVAACLCLPAWTAAPRPATVASAPEAEARTVLCTLRHPSYSGDCKQTASIPEGGSGRAVCKEILDCLNTVQCSKTYCNATEIRGGWSLVSAEETPAKK